ncbi:MAG: CLC_0170 family protein [Bacillota bacterium]
MAAILKLLPRIFGDAMVMLMIGCGVWSIWMIRPAMGDKQLSRESRVAAIGGWIYLVLGITGYLAVTIIGRYLP